MNPDKLFDYLDGKLDPAEREQFETRLASDSQLLRQLAVARDIHRGMGGARVKREVVLPPDDLAVAERGRKLGGRIAAAALALILLNVFGGLAAITYLRQPKAKKTDGGQLRRQVEDSMRAVAAANAPAPGLADDVIEVTADKEQLDNLAGGVIAAAEACGGSGIGDRSQPGSVTVTARIPAERYMEFRQKVAGPNARPLTTGEVSSAGTKIVQIHIAAAGP